MANICVLEWGADKDSCVGVLVNDGGFAPADASKLVAVKPKCFSVADDREATVKANLRDCGATLAGDEAHSLYALGIRDSFGNH